MSPVTLNIQADIKRLSRELDRLAYSQMPFATALALTGLAKRVQADETEALGEVFDNPVAFTMRAFAIIPARKSNLTATVFAKDIQAEYLKPSEEEGTPQALGKGRRIRTPVDIGVNASGDIPKGAIKRLLAKPGVFLATIDGVSGLWQRMDARKGRGRRAKTAAASARPHKLKLLIAFTRPKPVKTRLDYRSRAAQVVAAHTDEEFSVAMRRALSTLRI
jgi:hypothetical protein